MSSKKKTKYLILGLLSEAPLSGYEIKKIVDLRFSHFWSESYGQIYPELNKLHKESSIRKLDNQDDEKGRSSCKYEITSKGLAELKEWLEVPAEKEVIRYELLLKLYFSNLGSTDTMIEQIRDFQINHRKQLKMFEVFQKDLLEHFDTHDNHAEVMMVLMFGQKVWGAYDEWCEQVLNLLSKRKELTKGDFSE